MKWRMVLFTLPLLTVIVFAHVYLYRHWMRRVPQRWIRVGVVVLSVIGLTFGFGSRIFGPLFDGELRRVLVTTSMIWAGFLLYVLLFTVTIALGDRYSMRRRKRPVVDPERRHLLGAGVALVSTGFAGIGLYRAFAEPEITETIVPVRGLPKALEGFTIAQISDIHVGAIIQRSFLQELVLRTNGIRPDITVITGDLVDGTVAHLGGYVRELQALQARRGVYFITGNHDYYSGADAWCAAVQGLGIEVMRNRNIVLAEGLVMAGVDDWSAPRFGEPGYDLDKALIGVDRDKATILLAHQPANFDEVAKRGIGLQISGHTHAGQFFPITLGATAIWGDRAHGLSRTGDSYLYVNKGCGFVGPPFRGGAAPEIAKIVLVSA
jgi:predicted MPP superfamily phosphohydrolase